MLNLKWSRLARETWTLLLMIVVALLIIGVNEWSYQRSAKSRKVLVDNTAAREQINNVLQRLTDAESGQRGYFVTGAAAFLQPYHSAENDIEEALNFLKTQYQSEPTQRQIVAKINQFSSDMLADLAILLRLRQQNAQDALLEKMLLNRGKGAMDAIRANAKKLRDNELKDLMHERERVQKTMDLTRIGVNALTLLGVLGYALFLKHIARFNAERRQHALALERQRDQLEIDVLRRTEELSELTLHLQTAREDERARVARELHDELGALLTAAKFDTARLKRSLGAVESDVSDRIKHLNATINEGIALKRRIIEDLRPSALTNLGLIAALEIQAREFEQRTGLTLKLDFAVQQVSRERHGGQVSRERHGGQVSRERHGGQVSRERHGGQMPLSDDAKLTIYRLVQESLTNTAKYACASQVQIKLRLDDTRVVVTVIDNGKGFNPAAIPKNSHGLTGMRYRVEAHGGKMRLNSSNGSGTQIEAWLPINASTV